MRRPAVVTVLHQAQLIAATELPRISWRYVPREANKVQITRFEAAIPRLRKIERLPIEIKEKIRLIKAGVLQAALAFSEIIYIGAKHFQHLRDQVCTVLCYAHHWAHRKTALFLRDPEVDPLLCALFMQIRMLRRSLWSNDQAWSFALGVLSGDIEHPGVPFGPLTALRAYLASVDLTVDGEGFLHSSSRPKVHLREDDWLLLRDCILVAWGQSVSTELGSRRGVARDLDIDWDMTRLVIGKLSSVQDVGAVHTRLAGAIATEERYSKVSNCSPNCPVKLTPLHIGCYDAAIRRRFVMTAPCCKIWMRLRLFSPLCQFCQPVKPLLKLHGKARGVMDTDRIGHGCDTIYRWGWQKSNVVGV